MTVKQLLYGALSIIGLVTLGLSTVIGVGQYYKMRDAHVALVRLDILRKLADIPALVNPERGVLQLMIQAPGQATPELRAMADTASKATDAAIATANTIIQRVQGQIKDGPALLTGFKTINDSWMQTRKRAQEQARLPAVDRGDAASQVLIQSGETNAVTNSLMAGQLRQLAGLNGEAFRFAAIADTVWELRDVGGRQAGMLQNLVSAHAPLTLDQRTAIQVFEGQVGAIWTRLQPLLLIGSTPSALKDAITSVQKIYIEDYGATKVMLARSFDTGDFGWDAATYQKNVSPMWKSVVGLRNAAYTAGADILSATEAKAMMATWIAFGAIAAVLSTMAGVLFLLQIRVIRPIGAMTIAMRRLAAGDLSVIIPATNRRDEMGAMATAMQVFKDTAGETHRHAAEADLNRATAAETTRVAQEEAANRAIAEERAFVVAMFGTGVQALADGNLTIRLNSAMPGEYERLRVDFNDAAERLEQTMQAIVTSAGAISTGTGEIAAAAEDLSRRTEQQAATLEETAAALDEITATVRQTAEGAGESRAAVSIARKSAEQSGQVVNSAVAAMREIEDSARQITQIIGTIDEIAFQTNLLALSAGIEAARAGDAGRGFAVVASEVRALSQRSAQAAKEIKGLISTSTHQVERGVELVADTGQSLTKIIEQVAEVDRLVRTIASAAQEQATGLHQVNNAVNQMAQVTQQNAAMVEQSTGASHSLAMETEELTQAMARFAIGSNLAVAA